MIPIYTTKQTKAIDAESIAFEGISSVRLMERAAIGLFECLCRWIPSTSSVLILAGPGNNGGDALALARLFVDKGYTIRCFLFSGGKELAADCQENANRLEKMQSKNLRFVREASLETLRESQTIDFIIDGIFGSGLNRPIEGFFAEIVRWINQQNTYTFSIDIPSGLFGEDNHGNRTEHIVQADRVLGIQHPHLAFLLPENARFVKQWSLSPLAFPKEVLQQHKASFHLIEKSDVNTLLAKRNTFDHKGKFGHGLLIAGSYQMSGAAILSGRAALRSGIGLLSLCVPQSIYPTVQAAVPEAMVQRDLSEKQFSTPENLPLEKYSAIAIGPGLGCGTTQALALETLLDSIGQKPMVLDADALTILSQHPEILSKLPEGSILTPHPKEFDRLAGTSSDGYERLSKATRWAVDHQVYLILKGAYTAILFPDGQCFFNPTGNPGMATRGSGDVLSGILLSLLAQKLTPEQACLLGVYLHGLSGDLALEKQSEESLTAGDLIENLGAAFHSLRK